MCSLDITKLHLQDSHILLLKFKDISALSRTLMLPFNDQYEMVVQYYSMIMVQFQLTEAHAYPLAVLGSNALQK